MSLLLPLILASCTGTIGTSAANLAAPEAAQLLTNLLTAPVGICATVLTQNAIAEAGMVRTLTQPQPALVPIRAARHSSKIKPITVPPPPPLPALPSVLPSFSLCVSPDGKVVACPVGISVPVAPNSIIEAK